MAKYLENFPKKFPTWNENYPCPTEITLYTSAVVMKRMKKDFPLPKHPDFTQIFKEYNDAQ